MPGILIIVGIVLNLYAGVSTVHDSTAKAMGALAVKKLARLAGIAFIIVGVGLALS